jgi:hypothetical protein
MTPVNAFHMLGHADLNLPRLMSKSDLMYMCGIDAIGPICDIHRTIIIRARKCSI